MSISFTDWEDFTWHGDSLSLTWTEPGIRGWPIYPPWVALLTAWNERKEVWQDGYVAATHGIEIPDEDMPVDATDMEDIGDDMQDIQYWWMDPDDYDVQTDGTSMGFGTFSSIHAPWSGMRLESIIDDLDGDLLKTGWKAKTALDVYDILDATRLFWMRHRLTVDTLSSPVALSTQTSAGNFAISARLMQRQVIAQKVSSTWYIYRNGSLVTTQASGWSTGGQDAFDKLVAGYWSGTSAAEVDVEINPPSFRPGEYGFHSSTYAIFQVIALEVTVENQTQFDVEIDVYGWTWSGSGYPTTLLVSEALAVASEDSETALSHDMDLTPSVVANSNDWFYAPGGGLYYLDVHLVINCAVTGGFTMVTTS